MKRSCEIFVHADVVASNVTLWRRLRRWIPTVAAPFAIGRKGHDMTSASRVVSQYYTNDLTSFHI